MAKGEGSLKLELARRRATILDARVRIRAPLSSGRVRHFRPRRGTLMLSSSSAAARRDVGGAFGAAVTIAGRHRGPAHRLLTAAIVGSLLGLSGCRAVPGDVMVTVRNLSPQAITLTTEEPGQVLFPRTNSHQIQPWVKGTCFAHLGLDRGHITLTVSGSNIPAPVAYEATIAPDAVEHSIGVQIEAGGQVEFGVTIPADTLPCTGGGY